MKLLINLSLCIGLVACHEGQNSRTTQPPLTVDTDDSDHTDKPNGPDNPGNLDKPGGPEKPENDEVEAAMLKQLQAALESLEKWDKDGKRFDCTLENHVLHEPCQLKSLTYSPLTSADPSRTQVLIMDEGMELPALLRFKSQSLGIHQISPNGDIEERYRPGDDTGVRVPRVLADLYEQWSSLSHAPFLPHGEQAGWLFDRLGAFLLEDKLLGFDITDHGNPLYFKLMELNPDSEVLTVQNTKDGGIFPWKKFRSANRECILGAVDKAQEVRDIFASLTDNVLALVQQHGIDYIQLTTGYNREVLLDQFPECAAAAHRSGVENFLRSYQSFEKALATIPGTVLVQSAWTSPQLLSMAEANSLEHADCNRYENKILAHPANFLPQLTLPKEGLALSPEPPMGLVDQASLNLRNCGGFYVSVGKSRKGPKIKNDRPMGFTNTGLYLDDEYYLSSSYIAPVLLGYLNYMRVREHGVIPADESLRRLPQAGIIEPLRYGQFLTINQDIK